MDRNFFPPDPIVPTYNNIVILTGAGLSAESGLGTFRGPGGLWENFRIEDVATPDAFARDPARAHEFYNLRRCWHKAAKPNAAHLALAGLEREHGNVLTVTQNIDALHEAAGSARSAPLAEQARPGKRTSP